ncbi:hypothetical protein EHM92_08225, partial [bacterium]
MRRVAVGDVKIALGLENPLFRNGREPGGGMIRDHDAVAPYNCAFGTDRILFAGAEASKRAQDNGCVPDMGTHRLSPGNDRVVLSKSSQNLCHPASRGRANQTDSILREGGTAGGKSGSYLLEVSFKLTITFTYCSCKECRIYPQEPTCCRNALMQAPSSPNHQHLPRAASVPALRRILLIASLFLCSASISFSSPEERGVRPLLVGKIFIDQKNVFDDSGATVLPVVGSIANTVHVLTDEEVIRRELLFKEGDVYDQRLVDESGQNLRRLGIIGDVVLACDTLPDYTVLVTVRVRDRWTLRPGVSLRQDGDREGFSITVREENFLGNAQKVRIGYNHLTGPGSPHGGEIAFTEPRLWGSRWSTTVQYGVSQELRVGAFNAERPFYSEGAAWAARFSADVSRTWLRDYPSGLVSRSAFINQEHQLAWVASSSRSDVSVQASAAYIRMRTRAVGYLPRAFENVDLVVGSLSLLHREYARVNSADVFGRLEDVATGSHAGVAFGRNLHFAGAGTVDYFLQVFGQRSLIFAEKFYATYQARFTSYFNGWAPYETT